MFMRAALGIGVGALALATDMAAGAAVAVLARMSRLFELWAFVSGGLDLAVASGILRGEGGRLLGVAGAVSVAVAVMLAVRPPIGIPLLVLWVGGYAIVVGILLLVRVMRLA
jgi:uncharacterized membrane protein HdeD (DUF308 family)